MDQQEADDKHYRAGDAMNGQRSRLRGFPLDHSVPLCERFLGAIFPDLDSVWPEFVAKSENCED